MKLTFSKFIKLMSTDLVESDLLLPIVIEAYVITALMLINMYSVIFIYGMITGQTINVGLYLGIPILLSPLSVLIGALYFHFNTYSFYKKK